MTLNYLLDKFAKDFFSTPGAGNQQINTPDLLWFLHTFYYRHIFYCNFSFINCSPEAKFFVYCQIMFVLTSTFSWNLTYQNYRIFIWNKFKFFMQRVVTTPYFLFFYAQLGNVDVSIGRCCEKFREASGSGCLINAAGKKFFSWGTALSRRVEKRVSEKIMNQSIWVEYYWSYFESCASSAYKTLVDLLFTIGILITQKRTYTAVTITWRNWRKESRFVYAAFGCELLTFTVHIFIFTFQNNVFDTSLRVL